MRSCLLDGMRGNDMGTLKSCPHLGCGIWGLGLLLLKEGDVKTTKKDYVRVSTIKAASILDPNALQPIS